MSDFVVGEKVQYRDWGWVTTPSGRDEYSVIWRDVEIAKVCKVRVKIKHADGKLTYADTKNLRKTPPILAAAPNPPAACTCQICGRKIKATTGVIAHHGYQRPGHGWQTSSCSGARHKPYEVSCDAIAPAIENVKAYIAREEAFLVEFAANPPASLSYSRGETYRKSERINVDRPADFTPDGRHRTYRPGAYDTLYHAQKYRIETDIKHARNDLAYLEKRLADWKAPEAAAAPTEYVYLCMNRPPLWETVPAGYTDTRPHPDSEYGIVAYDKPLTLEQRYKYQLCLVSPMFEPVKGLKVRFHLRGKIYEDVLDCPHEKYEGFWYTENEGHVRLADMEVIE